MSMEFRGLFVCLILNDGFSLFYIQFLISFFTIWYSCCQWASGAASAYWGIFCLLVAANGAEQHSNTNIRGRPSTSAWHIAWICQLPRICWERRSFITSAHAGLMPLGKQSQGGGGRRCPTFFEAQLFSKPNGQNITKSFLCWGSSMFWTDWLKNLQWRYVVPDICFGERNGWYNLPTVVSILILLHVRTGRSEKKCHIMSLSWDKYSWRWMSLISCSDLLLLLKKTLTLGREVW